MTRFSMTIRRISFALVSMITLSSSAFAGGYGGGYGDGYGYGQPDCKIVYETRYRTVTVTKYRDEVVTDYVEQECQVPRQITKTLYKQIQVPVVRTITEYEEKQIDKGYWGNQSYVDTYGCTASRKVWIPNICTIKVPCERQITEYVTQSVPYDVTETVYDTIVKKIPVQRTIQVPYDVVEQVPYQVAKKVCCNDIAAR